MNGGENIKLEEMSPKIREIYIRNHLDEEILDLTLDSAFKKVFSDEKNKWLLAFLIDYCTNLGIDYIMKHLRYKNSFISSNNLSNKTGEGDLIVEVDNKIINLEMNRSVTETLIRKNKFYVTATDSAYTRIISNKVIDSKFVIQINISNAPRIKNTNKLMYEIVLMDRNLKVEDAYNNFIIYDINLDYLQKELYNKCKLSKREQRLLIFIEKNKNILNNLYRGDVNMKETLDNLDGIGYFKDNDFALVYDHEAFNEVVHQEELEEVTKELEKEKNEILLKQEQRHQDELEEVTKELEKEKEKNEILLKQEQRHQDELEEKNKQINSMVNSMFKNNIDITVISKITNMNIEDLEKLKNEKN